MLEDLHPLARFGLGWLCSTLTAAWLCGMWGIFSGMGDARPMFYAVLSLYLTLPGMALFVIGLFRS